MSELFVLYRRQPGTGCDYMIGCGETIDLLKAQNKEDAIEEAKKLLESGDVAYSVDGEPMLFATLFHGIASLTNVCQRLTEQDKKARKIAELDNKREQLAKLKKELGEE